MCEFMEDIRSALIAHCFHILFTADSRIVRRNLKNKQAYLSDQNKKWFSLCNYTKNFSAPASWPSADDEQTKERNTKCEPICNNVFAQSPPHC